MPIGVAHAEQFNVPAGRLGDVAVAIGVQAGITVTVTDPVLAARRSPGVRGRYAIRGALEKALEGTGAEPIFYDRRTVRLVRRQMPSSEALKPRRTPTPPLPSRPPVDIIVTASKQRMSADDYPGSIRLVKTDPAWLATKSSEGTAALTRLLPSLGSTNLGAGRNKLFIRGIADSSFNGPSQATVGQYLGDVRLTYNAPDPDLNLYDMKQVEVLVGPQGTLYGAGSLGGVLRLVPNLPDSKDFSVSASTGLGVTQHGGISRDGAGMLNIPIVEDHLAARFVVFGSRRAGYIDDPGRGLADVNGTLSFGERFSLRLEGEADWSLDMGFVLQNIESDDGQYVLRSATSLTRDSVIPQPFHNNYRLGYVSYRRNSGGVEIVSTTSLSRHELRTIFDATGYDGTGTPARFEEENDISLLSHETRFSGGSGRSTWVAGGSALFSVGTISRSLGPLEAPEQITGVVNTHAEVAIFGQISRPLSSTLTGTVGERATLSSSRGFLIDSPVDGDDTSRRALRLSGTLALDWRPGGRWSAFFHYQQGYRPAGLAVAPAGADTSRTKFLADDLNMNELGLRLGEAGKDRLTVRGAIFFADWNNIQADLVDASGLPYSTNIGRGILYGLDGEVGWQALPDLKLSVAAFLNDSNLTKPEREFRTGKSQTLPNIARDGGRVAAEWRRMLPSGATVSGDASVRYVGKSRLGVGSLLDISQGNYFEADAGIRVQWACFGLSLDIENIGDVKGNSFAFGNPFGVANRDQVTPLRPRTVRFGIDARF
ncbi:TonB-dependent receptor [Sphingobium yanoikuyae]|uniref:TonB-dependent receptor n=1 Tax=Sphingobium yanoikuyae TaxID=13690 RepID=UPI002FD97C08